MKRNFNFDYDSTVKPPFKNCSERTDIRISALAFAGLKLNLAGGGGDNIMNK